jgi:two-component system, OmpR family, sensor kinase
VTAGSHGPGGLAAVRITAADLAVLKRLPVDNRPVSRELSSLGDCQLTAFTGPDRDVHIAGLPLSGVTDTVRTLELIEVIVFGSALVLMGLAGTAWIRLALRPLGRVTATAAEVSDLPLESGEVALPHRVAQADPRTEVGRLGRAFNQMLGHVEASLATRQASEAKLRRFVADASHELRTPLAGIRGYTELALRTGGDLSPDVRSALVRVGAESERMSWRVDDLLLLARLDAGRPLAHEPVDLTKLAVEATSDARVAGPGHHWLLDLPTEPVVVTGDQHRLHQVLANLLSNARTHTPPGTTITVRVASAARGDEVEISVGDDGPGIPAELQQHIWERFARGDTARSRKSGSTGLGLAIVRAVVTAHSGQLDLASLPGSTTFMLRLPARPAG